MAKKPAPRTFHHMDVAASLKAQSQAVMMLLQTVNAALSLDGNRMSAVWRDELRKQADAVQAVMWPQDGGE